MTKTQMSEIGYVKVPAVRMMIISTECLQYLDYDYDRDRENAIFKLMKPRKKLFSGKTTRMSRADAIKIVDTKEPYIGLPSYMIPGRAWYEKLKELHNSCVFIHEQSMGQPPFPDPNIMLSIEMYEWVGQVHRRYAQHEKDVRNYIRGRQEMNRGSNGGQNAV